MPAHAGSLHPDKGGGDRKRKWRRLPSFVAIPLLVLGGVGLIVANQLAHSVQASAAGPCSASGGNVAKVTYCVVSGSNEVDWTLAATYADPVLVDYGENQGGNFSTGGSVTLAPGQEKPTFMDWCDVAFDTTGQPPETGSFTVPANCAPPVQKPTVNLSISKSEITAGDAAPTLSWTSQNATSLTASDDWSGSKTVPSGSETVPSSDANKPGTYTYMLTTDSNAKGHDSDSVTLKVDKKSTPPPPQCVTANTGNMGATSSGTTASVNPQVNVCATTLYWQEYAVPSTWDGNGFDASAVPQQRVAVDSKTVKGAGQVSFSVALNTTAGQYTWQNGCYVNRQIDLTDVNQTTVDSSGSHGTLYTYDIGRFKVSDKPCNYVPPPTPAKPSVKVAAASCVTPGALNGKTLITVTNTADDTHSAVSYTVAVTSPGKTDVTLHTGPLADGASQTLTVLGLQPGSYGVAVTGDDMTGAGTSFVLTACQTPPPPTKQVVSVNIAATGANCGPKAVETYYVGGQLDKVTTVVTLAGKQVSLSSTDSFMVDSGQTWRVVFTVKDSSTYELQNGTSTESFSGKNAEKPFACQTPPPPNHHTQPPRQVCAPGQEMVNGLCATPRYPVQSPTGGSGVSWFDSPCNLIGLALLCMGGLLGLGLFSTRRRPAHARATSQL